MNTQTPIAQIAASLALAQNEIAVADKNAVNTDKKSRFADMASVTEACREALAKQGISILQPLGGSASELLISTVLLHSSGEFLESEFRVRITETSTYDDVKSIITQTRRYSLMGMLCIATADDDGAKGKPAKPAEKKPPVQDPGPVVETHTAEPPTTEETPAPADPVTTVVTNDAWKEVVCHFGGDSSPAKNRKLGEMEPEVLQFVQDKVLPALGKTKKDKALAAAIEESKKAQSTPATATDTLPEREKAVEPPPNAKETASEKPAEPAKAAAEEPMEWRSIAAHNFLKNPKITLGEIADSAPDRIVKGWNAEKLMRSLKNDGVAKLREKGKDMTTKDKILVNAILAANDEMDEREKVRANFTAVDYDDEKTDAFLVKNGILEEGQTLDSTDMKLLAYIRDQWSVIEKTIKEAKK